MRHLLQVGAERDWSSVMALSAFHLGKLARGGGGGPRGGRGGREGGGGRGGGGGGGGGGGMRIGQLRRSSMGLLQAFLHLLAGDMVLRKNLTSRSSELPMRRPDRRGSAPRPLLRHAFPSGT